MSIEATYKATGEIGWGGKPVMYFCVIGEPDSITWSRSYAGLENDPEDRDLISSLCYDDALFQFNEWMTKQAETWLAPTGIG